MNNDLNDKNLLKSKFSEEVSERFLSYAMSVIISRALPLVNDGLKPVHRRILYAMYGLRLSPDKPYKKSARIVGEVIGKYHPHGDVAVYEAMTKMIQDFACNYPLIDGHGNFGSIDGDSAAAMRYTEVRLTKMAWETLQDLNYNTVDFTDNYDGSEREPTVLPGYIPNLLINGSLGIAVGMATSIPPHNFNEILDVIIAYLKNENITLETLINEKKFLGPDFPTGALLVVTPETLIDFYQHGKGSFKLRAKYHFENDSRELIIDEIPYQVNKAKLITKIADLVKQKILTQIADLRDESNRLGIRIVITLKKESEPSLLLNKLFKLTPLQVNFAMNILALHDKKPEIMNLLRIVKYYVAHQINILTRKTNYLLASDQKSLLIAQAMNKALLNIEEVIALIKEAKDAKTASLNLQTLLKINEIQAKAILEMKLQRLTTLEQTKVIDEEKKLKKQILEYQKILNNPQHQKDLLIEKMESFKQKYAIPRRTEILEFDRFANIKEEDLIPHKKVLVCLSNENYIKIVELSNFRHQARGGIGIKGMKLNSDDYIKAVLAVNNHDKLLFFTNLGKVYRLKTWKLPDVARIAKGKPAQNLLKLSRNENVESIIPLFPEFENSKDKQYYLFFVTEKGIVKKTKLEEFARINQTGKIAIKLKKNDRLIRAFLVENDNDILLSKDDNLGVRFNSKKIRATGRSSQGVIGTKLSNPAVNKVIMGTYAALGQKMLTVDSLGSGKLTPLQNYRVTNRGNKGVTLVAKNKKSMQINKVITYLAVDGDETLLLAKKTGKMILVDLKKYGPLRKSRSAKGVKLVKLEENDSITAATVLKFKL